MESKYKEKLVSLENGETRPFYEFSPISCEHPVIIQSKDLYDKLVYCRNVYLGTYSRFIDLDYLKLIQSTLKSDKYISVFSKRSLGVTLENYMDFYCFNSETGETFPMFQVVPCGKCRLCRKKKVNEMCTRCFCEDQTAKSVPLMITLTYNPENLPKDNSISKVDLQKFIKRLREHFCRLWDDKTRIRYIACGEYGTNFGRPHYHLMIWNYPYFNTWESIIHEIESCWPKGYVYVKYCRDSNASRYICKYMLKQYKMADNDDREKPFFLSSRRMGIGYAWIEAHLNELRSTPYCNSIKVRDNRTGVLKEFPLPTYFRDKVWPTLSRLVPKQIRDDFFNFLHIGRQMCTERWRSRTYYYDDILQKVSEIGNKFDFLGVYYPNYKKDLLYCVSPVEYDKNTKHVEIDSDYRILHETFENLYTVLYNINLPSEDIRMYLAKLRTYKNHFMALDNEPVDLQAKIYNYQKQLDLSIQREIL